MASETSVALENITVLDRPGGLTLNLHPGVVSEVVFTSKGGVPVTVYMQQRVHNLRGMSPPKTHEFRMSGKGEDVGIIFNDPDHRITRVTIELASDGRHTGWGAKESDQNITLEMQARTCPPVCSDETEE